LLDERSFARALYSADVAVQLDHVPASGALMQPVDILGDQQESRHATLQVGERAMTSIGLRSRN